MFCVEEEKMNDEIELCKPALFNVQVGLPSRPFVCVIIFSSTITTTTIICCTLQLTLSTHAGCRYLFWFGFCMIVAIHSDDDPHVKLFYSWSACS